MRGIGIFTIVVFGTFYKGLVAMMLWHWFIAPLGAPSIGLFHAMGIGLAVDSFLGSRGMVADIAAYNGSAPIASDQDFIRVAFNVFVPSFLLFAGLITKGMMS